MRSKNNIIAVLAFYCSLLTANCLLFTANCSLINAQWSTDPNVNLQVSSWGQYPVACTDGEGGVYIRWEQNSYTTDQYIQHVNKYGYVRWTTPVEVYGTQNGTAFEGKICPDDSNGVIVLFTEWNVIGGDPQYFTHKRVRVNRLDSNGNKLWGEYGVRVSMRDTSQALREIVTDGQKGCIVAFLVAPDSLYVQRISSSGQRMWGEEGVFIHKSSYVTAIKDDSCGLFLQYWDGNTYFKRIDPNGNILWQLNSSKYYSKMFSCNGNAITSGITSGLGSIIVNRIQKYGNILWGSNGLTLDDTCGNQGLGVNISNVDTLFFTFTWNKPINNITHLFTQRVNNEGDIVWNNNIQISSNDSEKYGCFLIPSDNKSTIYCWYDLRNSGNDPLYANIYAQKLDSNGNRLWTFNDVCITNRDISSLSGLLSDQNDGAIILWDEAPLNGIFIQQINKNGQLGVLTNINDNTKNIFKNFILHQNYPNPLNASTTIEYNIFKNGYVILKIYNILGQEVATLVDNYQNAGHYKIHFDSKNLSSGLYFYRLKINNFSDTRKFLLIK